MPRPYHHIPIWDCGEPLVPIPECPELWQLVSPHPYQKLGADYGDSSPFMLRSGVINALIRAGEHLQQNHPHWRLLIVDAYRPLSVQKFMVEHSLGELLKERGWTLAELSPMEVSKLQSEVHQFWAVPSDDPHTPPPHSTGSAIDLTLLTPDGIPADMGSPIDEISPRSHPDYFQDSHPELHHHRQILAVAMLSAGWVQHPHEWWHFSYGDQMWAWLTGAAQAHYGRIC
ncbi:MAG: M15 family metallopeptidase [Pseudanabaenaceae cyanobacterium]